MAPLDQTVVERAPVQALVAPFRRVAVLSSRALSRLERVRPASVVGALVVVDWIATAAVALSVHHDGWLWSRPGRGGSAYATAVLLRHGDLSAAHGGYGWSLLLLPFSALGSGLHAALPAVVLLNVLVLLPVTLLALYGIGERLGGRVFGYWVLAVWIVLPLIGIAYTNPGFKRRYTELTLPEGLGLTASAAFAATAMLAVAAYLLLRTLQGGGRWDGVLAGLCAGFAIAIEPSAAPFLAGVALVLLYARRLRPAAAFAAGLAAVVAALAFWSWRSVGYVPPFHHGHALRLATYLDVDWATFTQNLDSLREHFWSARLVEWIVVAGIVALARRGRVPFLLLGGWFAGFVVFRAATPGGGLESGVLLRNLIPAIPPFVVMVASLPLLVPGLPRRLRSVGPPRPWGTPRRRLTAVAVATLLFAVVPIALTAAAAAPLR